MTTANPLLPSGRSSVHAVIGLSLLVAALLILTFLCPPWLQEGLVYRPERLRAGDWWTLLTTHALHHNLLHLSVNLLTWGLVCGFLAPVLRSWSEILGVLVLIAVASTGTAYYLWPDPRGFIGSSGVIYGVLAYGSLQGMLRGPRRRLYALALFALILKITVEHYQGASSWEAGILGGAPVIPGALGSETTPIEYRLHTAGVVWGLVLGALAKAKQTLLP